MNNEEIFNQYVTSQTCNKLKGICNNFDIPDNNVRADIMMKEVLHQEGFKEIGCGTNRIVVSNKICNYDIVFKIALDNRGIEDNNSEMRLSKHTCDELGITCDTYYNNGLVAISENYPAMNSDQMYENEEEVLDMLHELSKYYVLNDVGLKQFRNWGIKNGIIKLIDFAYLTPLDKIKTKRCLSDDCNGKIIYTKDLSGFKCKKCGRQYRFAELISDKKYIENEWVMVDSLNTKEPPLKSEINNMNIGSHGKKTDISKLGFVPVDDK